MARRGTSWAAAEFHGKSGAGGEEGPNGAVPYGEGKSGQWGERGGGREDGVASPRKAGGDHHRS